METKLKIAEAALETLKERGYARTSAREIAARGDFNQALIFYHYGSVEKLLLAVLDLVSDRRMEAYREPFLEAQTPAELLALVRRIHAEDLENGYVTVLSEMVGGGVSNAALGAQVIARLQPWMDMVEAKLRELPLLASLIPPRDAAFALIALYLGVDMLTQLAGDPSRAEALLDLGARYVPPTPQPKEPR
jgi:AcrR family transcriptional regulator